MSENPSNPRLAVIYYSSTGTVHELAQAVAGGALDAGAEVRLRRVAELAPPDAIARNAAWRAHLAATRHVPEASLDDLDWADGFAFGTPVGFGTPSAQLKQFLDTTGGLWARGKLADKAATAFTSAQNPNGGQEATLLALHAVFCHWGAVIVPPGYTDPAVFAASGNPYGTSTTNRGDAPIADEVLAAARYQGARLARFARALARRRDDPAYFLFDAVEVTDAARFDEYRRLVRPLVERYGGRYVVVGGEVAVVEGGWAPRHPVMIEFPSRQAARRWYDSDEYRALKALRADAVRTTGVLLGGAASST